MMLKFLTCFFFIIFVQVPSTTSINLPDLNLSKHTMGRQEIQGINNGTLMGFDEDVVGREIEGKHGIVISRKAGKGKGAHGGGTMAHKPGKENIAINLSNRNSLFVSPVLAFVIWGFI